MANIIVGASGADALNGLSGENSILGGAGADKLNGGAGLDTIDGGSGSDTVSGNSGDDLLVFRAAENAGSRDVYDGGSGQDVLRLDLTLAEWLKPTVQADLANYQQFLNVNTNWHTLEANNSIFNFTSFGLAVSKIEAVRIFVDGQELSAGNDPVTLGSDSMTAGEDTAGVSSNLFLNDLVADQVASFAKTDGAHGTVAVATDFSVVNAPKAFATYTADGTYWNYLAVGETGSDSFTYTVTDADGQSATTTVNVTVTGANDEVAITSAAQTGAVVEDAQDTAAPDDSTIAGGTITFTDPDLTDLHTAQVTTAPASPLGALELGSVSEASDTAGGTVGWTYTLNSGAAQHLGAGVPVTETWVVTVQDAHGSSQTQSVTITITGTNDAPVITAGVVSASLDETDAGLTADGGVTATDVDEGDVVALSVDSVGVGGTGSTSLTNTQLKGMLSVDPDGAWHFDSGSEAFDNLAAGKTLVLSYVLKADDGNGGTDTETVTVTITGTNDAPVITSAATASAPENTTATTVVYDAAASDVDGGATVFSLGGADAARFDIDPATGEVTFKVSPDFEAPTDADGDNVYDVVVNAFDGTETAMQAVAISVTNVNEGPAITSDGGGETAAVGVPENTTTVTTVTATDPDAGASFTYSLVGGEDQAKFTIDAAGHLSFASAPDFEAPADADGDNSYVVTVRVSDGALADDQTLTVNVTDVVENSAPTAHTDLLIVSNGTPNAQFSAAALLKNDTDPDGDTLSFVGVGAGATYNAATGLVTWTSGGAGSFSYQMQDAGGHMVTGTATVQLAPQNATGGGDDIDISALSYVAAYIDGRNGNDSVTGGGGYDIFVGGNGADVLIGGDVADKLTGGANNDTLTGGAAGDVFVYVSTADGTDRILDFTEAGTDADLIDLSAIDAVSGGGDDAFGFVAAQNAGTVANSVTWQVVGGDTVVRLDTNGLPGAELTITLSGAHSLVAGDFLL